VVARPRRRLDAPLLGRPELQRGSLRGRSDRAAAGAHPRGPDARRAVRPLRGGRGRLPAGGEPRASSSAAASARSAPPTTRGRSPCR
jgi:hypothetical protein